MLHRQADFVPCALVLRASGPFFPCRSLLFLLRCGSFFAHFESAERGFFCYWDAQLDSSGYLRRLFLLWFYFNARRRPLRPKVFNKTLADVSTTVPYFSQDATIFSLKFFNKILAGFSVGVFRILQNVGWSRQKIITQHVGNILSEWSLSIVFHFPGAACNYYNYLLKLCTKFAFGAVLLILYIYFRLSDFDFATETVFSFSFVIYLAFIGSRCGRWFQKFY